MLVAPPSTRLKLAAAVLAVATVLLAALALLTKPAEGPAAGEAAGDVAVPAAAVGSEILLPLPRARSGVSVEEALLSRKSVRAWREEPLDIEDLAAILWAAQGVTERTAWYRRTAPSAGATYPLEVYVVVGERGVKNGASFLPAGVYKYNPLRHSLVLVKLGDARSGLWSASLRQEWVRSAPASLVICAVFERTTRVYGERGERYVYMEAGHAGQNIYLMAAALNLGTVAVGAFDDAAVAEVISAEPGEAPLYIYPVGVPREPYKGSFEKLHELFENARRG
ncbi:MAG: SagB/ThcOx family dehydrogenase [Thermofilum sp.]